MLGMKLWLFGTTFLVLAVAASFITRWWRYGGGRQLLLSLPLQSWPDFRKWDRRNEFKLDEAAALWFDAEPRSPMWWRARWKLRRLRAAIAPKLSVRQAPGTPHGPVHRDALRVLAEREGVHPLFLYPEFRFRLRDRDKEGDKARLASIHVSVRSAILNVESELGGLRTRLDDARRSSATLVATTGSRNDEESNGTASVEVRLLAPERRLEELKDHLAALRRIEGVVNKELYS
jgi:hypothetical protein